MPRNPDPDESIVLDYGVFRHAMIRHFKRDDEIDPDEHKLIKLFDTPYVPHKKRFSIFKAFDALMRNGLTRYTAEKAKDAGLMVVIGPNQYPDNVIPFPGTEQENNQAG